MAEPKTKRARTLSNLGQAPPVTIVNTRYFDMPATEQVILSAFVRLPLETALSQWAKDVSEIDLFQYLGTKYDADRNRSHIFAVRLPKFISFSVKFCEFPDYSELNVTLRFVHEFPNSTRPFIQLYNFCMHEPSDQNSAFNFQQRVSFWQSLLEISIPATIRAQFVDMRMRRIMMGFGDHTEEISAIHLDNAAMFSQTPPPSVMPASPRKRSADHVQDDDV